MTKYHCNKGDLDIPVSAKTTTVSQNLSLYTFSSIE